MTIRVGVVGTGFIAGLFVQATAAATDLRVTRVLTRRPLEQFHGSPLSGRVTTHVEELIAESDVVLECSGDVWHATDVIEAVVGAGLPVATMNAQFHVTVGSDFVGRGLVSECAGDQPGSLAALRAEVVGMGFTPVAYVSMKGFLDPNPTPESMAHWSERQGISIPMVTSFTDGTKLQIEQVLVANGCGAAIPSDGMAGLKIDHVQEAAVAFAALARQLGAPLSDYVLSGKLPHGVFIVATHQPEQAAALRYLKCGDGPEYAIVRPAIYAHLEAMQSIRQLVRDRRPLLDNSPSPRFSVVAEAKRDLKRGERLPFGIGSFDLRGRAVHMHDHPDHLPIGLVMDGVVTRAVSRGEMLQLGDVELPDGEALRGWMRVRERVRRETA